MEMEPDPGPGQPEGPRLIIERIVLENFKSYAGREEIGPFDPRFTSIIGPNGSGKSNVIDAMLFVFGYRARRLRQTKLADLIHNSSARGNLTSARVEVHFAKVFQDVPVDNSSFVLARDVYADGSSNYYWGDRRSNYSDITHFLRDEGIDLDHNRFLILQGEVETISLMKPKASTAHQTGLLEYIEDIIGSNSYIDSINDCERELTVVLADREAALGLMTHLQTERDAIEGARNEAQRYINTEQRITALTAEHHLADRRIVEGRIESAIARHEQISASLAEQVALEETKTSDLSSLESTLVQLQRDVTRDESHQTECEHRLRAIETRESELQLQTAHFTKRRSEASSELANTEKSQRAADAEEKNLEFEISKAESDLEVKTAEFDAGKERLDVLRAEAEVRTSDLRDRLSVAQKILLEQTDRIGSSEVAIRVLQDQISSIHALINDEVRRIEAKQRELQDATERHDRLSDELFQAQRDATEQAERQISLKAEAGSHEAEIEALVSERQHLSVVFAEMDEKRKRTQTQSKVQKGMNDLRAREGLSGIYGRLADLGTIDSKYDIAISTAAGGSLDFIVVDTTETARRCTSELEAKRLGRATFIILDKIAKVNSCEVPANAERLFDLVELEDPKFAPAFYFAVRDTLVVDNIDLATQIGLYSGKRRRVVTLDGKLVEPSGALAGGGQSHQRGGLSGVSESKFTETGDRLKELDQRLRNLKARRASVLGELGKLNVDRLEKTIRGHTVDLEGLRRQIPEMKRTLDELMRGQVGDVHKAKLPALEQSLAEKMPEYTEQKKELTKIEGEVRDLEAQIADEAGIDVRAQVGIVEGLKNMCGRLKKTITVKSAKLALLKKSQEKAHKRREEQRRLVDEATAELQKLEGSSADLKAEVDAARRELSEAERTFRDHERELKSVTDDVAKSKSALQKCKLLKADLEHQISHVGEEIQGLRQQCERLTHKLEAMEIDIEEISLRDAHEIEIELAIAKQQLEEMQPNMAAIEEYKRRDEQLQNQTQVFEELTNLRNAVQGRLEQQKMERTTMFMNGFHEIGAKLKEMYQVLTLGGDAELECVDRQNPFSEGISFTVRPPGKSWKHISNLSGGEKTLSSLALVFALHQFKATPLYIMDEIDAALDFRNVSIIANYLKQRTTQAQFIVISLRNNMFELANKLVGIVKLNDCTTSLTIEPGRFGGNRHSADVSPADSP